QIGHRRATILVFPPNPTCSERPGAVPFRTRRWAEIAMDHVDVANTFFTILTLLANAVVVVAVIFGVAALGSSRARALGRRVVAAVGPSAQLLAWIVAAVTTLGSLYYSEIANFVPCRLCWYQRICMYPLAVILLVGLLLRDRRVRWYALPFVVIGAPL